RNGIRSGATFLLRDPHLRDSHTRRIHRSDLPAEGSMAAVRRIYDATAAQWLRPRTAVHLRNVVCSPVANVPSLQRIHENQTTTRRPLVVKIFIVRLSSMRCVLLRC